jgi:histidinol dehydrogenase
LLGGLERRHELEIAPSRLVVQRIVKSVRKGGDSAIRKHAATFDRLLPQQPLQITAAEMEDAWAGTSRPVREALKIAASNIRGFAERQLPTDWSFSPIPGLTTGQMVRPIDAVGCYVPSGRHPLPSSLLMTVIPSAGCGCEADRRSFPEPGARPWLRRNC